MYESIGPVSHRHAPQKDASGCCDLEHIGWNLDCYLCGLARGKIPVMFIHTKPAASAWPAAMIVWGPGYRTAAHRHHSIQLVMATKGEFRIRGGRKDRWLTCGAALVRPDAVHEIDARNTPVLIAFVDA